jgi:hypothetical protein
MMQYRAAQSVDSITRHVAHCGIRRIRPLAPRYTSASRRFDRSDRDPVISTSVSVEFVPDMNDHVKSLDVIHNLFSGRTINRNDQYISTVSKKGNYQEWYWTGVQIRDRSVSMVGKLIHNDRFGWRHQGTVFKNGFIDHVIPFKTCSEGQGN